MTQEHPHHAPPPKPAPIDRPGDAGLGEWAGSQELAADAWRPELDRLIDRLDLRPGQTVLDAGCGPGRVTRWISSRVAPLGHVIGLDIDESALEWAAWSLRDLEGCGTTLELWHGDVAELPFADDTFDAVWCSNVLGYLPEPLEALRELVRVVRPGGRVLVMTGDAARWTFWPIAPDLESRLQTAEREAAAAQHWGSPVDLHLGRRLYSLASRLPVARVDAMSVVWERTAPLTDTEQRYLHRSVTWLTDPDNRPWLGDDWDACNQLFAPESDANIVLRPDLHVVQTASVAILTV